MNKESYREVESRREDNPYANCCIEQWIRDGNKRNLSYPENSLPQTRVAEAFVESAFRRAD